MPLAALPGGPSLTANAVPSPDCRSRFPAAGQGDVAERPRAPRRLARRVLRGRMRHLAYVLAAGLLSATPVAATIINVTTTADKFGTGAGCSLREAIYAADHNV